MFLHLQEQVLRHRFIVFSRYICQFFKELYYPLKKSLNFARMFLELPPFYVYRIKIARKLLPIMLFSRKYPSWIYPICLMRNTVFSSLHMGSTQPQKDCLGYQHIHSLVDASHNCLCNGATFPPDPGCGYGY